MERSTTPEGSASARPWRVLVADDNQDAGESLALLLQLHGHTTAWACDGVQALAMVESFKPEMLMLDIGMPGLDGHQVARRLRADPRHRDLILVALTGWAPEAGGRSPTSADFDLHLTKPARPEALLAYLERMSAEPALHERSAGNAACPTAV